MTKNRKSKRQADGGVKEFVIYLLGMSSLVLLQRLHLRVAYALGRSFGWLAWLCMRRRRHIVAVNLRVFNAWLREDEARIRDRAAFQMPLPAQVREVFQRSGANIFSGFTFARMHPTELEKYIEFEGVELLRSELNQNKGVVALLAHMGPWEALAYLPAAFREKGMDVSFGTMFRPLNNHRLDVWYRRQRGTRGTKLYSRRDGFHKPVDFVRSGGMLGVLADQKMGQGVETELFSQKVKANPLPGLFCMRSKARLFSATFTSIGRCRWKVRFRRVEDPHGSEGSGRELWAKRTNAEIEQMLASSPLDVFWFQRRYDKQRYRQDDEN